MGRCAASAASLLFILGISSAGCALATDIPPDKALLTINADAGMYEEAEIPFEAEQGYRFILRMSQTHTGTKWHPLQAICLATDDTKNGKPVCLWISAPPGLSPVLRIEMHDQGEKAEAQEWVGDVAMLRENMVLDLAVRDGVAQFMIDGVLKVEHKLGFTPAKLIERCSSAICTFGVANRPKAETATGKGKPLSVAAAQALERAQRKHASNPDYIVRLTLRLAKALEEEGQYQRALAHFTDAQHMAQQAWDEDNGWAELASEGVERLKARGRGGKQRSAGTAH